MNILYCDLKYDCEKKMGYSFEYLNFNNIVTITDSNLVKVTSVNKVINF